MESWLLAKRAQIESIVVRVQGMIAHNTYTMNTDNYVAYDETHFREAEAELESIYQEIMENR